MQDLTPQLFCKAAYDIEKTQYQIQAALKQARDAFSESKIYPYLGKLVKIHKTLNRILDQFDTLNKSRQEIKEIDLEKQKVVYKELPELTTLDIDGILDVVELMQWALPHIQDTIEEGRVIYDFVEDELQITEVGIVPQYTSEGYLLVPELSRSETKGTFHVLRYQLSRLLSSKRSDSKRRYRTLKTRYVKGVPYRVVGETTHPHPSTIKIDLTKEFADLPNPATYALHLSTPFPYQQTVLPIVKRRMIRYLLTQSGSSP